MQLKKTVYNLVSGLIGQIVTITLGILIPRLFIVSLGSEVNGLVSSVSQIFVYFGLLEAGVGLATTQALYKPIAQGNKNDINAILVATDRYYKKTGIIYFIGVIILSVIYPVVVTSQIDKFTIFIVIIFQGLGGVLSYFFQGKYRLLLQAEGKGYILTNLTTIIQIFISVGKIILLLNGFSVIAIQGMYFFFNIVQMLYITIYITKKYNWINLRVLPNTDAISQKKYVLIHQISGMIFSNTDVLILTLFCNLKIVSVYTMYNLFFNMINTFMNTISGSISFQLGQTYSINKKKFIKLYDIYETYYTVLNFTVCATMYLFILPFMKLYTRGITDANYIDSVLPFLFVCVNLLANGKLPSNQVINVAGHFEETKWKGICEALLNIVVSILGVIKFGLYGVLIGTIVALLYRANDMIIYANRKVIGRSPIKTYLRWGVNIVIFLLFINVGEKIQWNNSTYLYIIFNAGVFCLCIGIIYVLINSLIERNSLRSMLNYFYEKIRAK